MIRHARILAWILTLSFFSCMGASVELPEYLIVKLAESEPPANDALGYSVVIQSKGGECILIRTTGGELVDPLSGRRATTLRLAGGVDLHYVTVFPTDRSARLQVTLFEDAKDSPPEGPPESCSGEELLQRDLIIPPDESADASESSTTDQTTTTTTDTSTTTDASTTTDTSTTG